VHERCRRRLASHDREESQLGLLGACITTVRFLLVSSQQYFGHFLAKRVNK